MLIARAIVEQRFLLRRLANMFRRNYCRARVLRELRRNLERAECASRVTARVPNDLVDRADTQLESAVAETALLVGERAMHQSRDVFLRQRMQYEQPHPREQRRDDLERRILGRRADQRDQPALDVRQKRVLLRAIPSMDLVDENHGALAGLEIVARCLDRVAQIGDARCHRRKLAKHRARLFREHYRERRLAGARRTPQDHRMQHVRRDHLAEELSRTQQMLLADNFVERARPHPIRQRLAERSARWKQTLRRIGLAPCHFQKVSQ